MIKNITIDSSEDEKMEALERTFYPVMKIENQDSRYGYQIMREDTLQVLADVSEEYVLIRNRDAVMPFVDRYGIGKLMSIREENSRCFYKFDLGREIDFGGGDILRRQGYVTNSYNKTHRFMWQDAFFRKICSNGLFAFSSGASISEVHYGDFDFRREMNYVLRASGNDFDVETWRRLKNIKVGAEEKRSLIERFSPMEVHKTDLTRRHPSETLNLRIRAYAQRNAMKNGHDLENQENGWGLLNNINWGIARACGEKNLGRLISLNRKAEEFCSALLLN